MGMERSEVDHKLGTSRSRGGPFRAAAAYVAYAGELDGAVVGSIRVGLGL